MKKVDAVARGSVEPQPAALINPKDRKKASTNHRQLQRRGSARFFSFFRSRPKFSPCSVSDGGPAQALPASALRASDDLVSARRWRGERRRRRHTSPAKIPPELMSAAGITRAKWRRCRLGARSQLVVAASRYLAQGDGDNVAQLRTRSMAARRSWSRVPAACRRHPSPARGWGWLPSRQLVVCPRSSLVPCSFCPRGSGWFLGAAAPRPPLGVSSWRRSKNVEKIHGKSPPWLATRLAMWYNRGRSIERGCS